MRVVKPVLFSIVLSVSGLPIVNSDSGSSAPEAIETEPGGPLSAGAALVRVIETAGQLRAVVRLELLSGSEDLEATVKAAGEPRGRKRGEVIANAALGKGLPRTLTLESDIERDRENHLFYQVEGRGRGGKRFDTLVYLRVNLDPALEPEQVDGYVVYQGAQGSEVTR